MWRSQAVTVRGRAADWDWCRSRDCALQLVSSLPLGFLHHHLWASFSLSCGLCSAVPLLCTSTYKRIATKCYDFWTTEKEIVLQLNLWSMPLFHVTVFVLRQLQRVVIKITSITAAYDMPSLVLYSSHEIIPLIFTKII